MIERFKANIWPELVEHITAGCDTDKFRSLIDANMEFGTTTEKNIQNYLKSDVDVQKWIEVFLESPEGLAMIEQSLKGLV